MGYANFSVIFWEQQIDLRSRFTFLGRQVDQPTMSETYIDEDDYSSNEKF